MEVVGCTHKKITEPNFLIFKLVSVFLLYDYRTDLFLGLNKKCEHRITELFGDLSSVISVENFRAEIVLELIR